MDNTPLPVNIEDTGKKKIFIIIIATLSAMLVVAIITIASLIASKQAKTNDLVVNQVKDKDTAKNNTNTQKERTTTIDSSFNYTMSLVYPDTWSLSSSIEGPMPATNQARTIQSLVFTSPSGNIKVVFKVSANVKPEGTCDQKAAGQFVTVRAETVPGLPVVNLVEYTIRNYTTPYPNGPYYVGLVETNTARLFATDRDLCAAFNANIVKLKDDKDVRLLDASMLLRNIYSIEDFALSQATDEYKEAKSILLSAKHQ